MGGGSEPRPEAVVPFQTLAAAHNAGYENCDHCL